MLLIYAHLCMQRELKQLRMKSLLICIAVLLFSHLHMRAQTATLGTLEYQRAPKMAAVIELPYEAETVEGAIRKRLVSATVKEERSRGLHIYKGGRVTPTDGEKVDFYFRIRSNGTSSSTVYLILGRPGENVALRPADDDYRVQDARKFLNAFVPIVSAYQLELDIAATEDLVKKTERILVALADDQKILEERISELQERLAQNKRTQESQNAELARHRAAKDQLLAKRTAASKTE